MAYSKKGRRLIGTRDFEMMKYLWYWKILSTQALAKKFFLGIRSESAANRIRQLAQEDYLMEVMVENKRYAWCLGKRGFEMIRHRLGYEVHEGYRSEYPRHDFITTAFHLGEWLTHRPEGAEIFTEQQMRCIPDDVWPEWIPQSTIHRPDGYSQFTLNGKTVLAAFETELSLKAKRRYQDTAYFYAKEASIDFVFWLVSLKSAAKSIRHISEKNGVTHIDRHCFLLLEDFLKMGWDTPMIDGCLKGNTLLKTLNPGGITGSSLWHHSSDVSSILDTRRKPILPDTSASTGDG